MSSEQEARAILADDAYSREHAPAAHLLMAQVSGMLYGPDSLGHGELRDALEDIFSSVGISPRHELDAHNTEYVNVLLRSAYNELAKRKER